MGLPETRLPFALLRAKELPSAWLEVATGAVGARYRVAPGHWFWKKAEAIVVELAVYGGSLDWIVGHASGTELVPEAHLPSEVTGPRRAEDPPPDVRLDLESALRANIAAIEAASAPRHWTEGSECPSCTDGKNTIPVGPHDVLHRCPFCGTFWKREYESELSASGLYERSWCSPCETADAIDRLAAASRLIKAPSDESPVERPSPPIPTTHTLPWKIPAGDVVPLGKALFQELDLSFEPVESVLDDGTHRYLDPSGRTIEWAHVTAEPFSWADVVGGEEHNLLAKIVVSPDAGVSFEFFAGRLVRYRVWGEGVEAERVEAAMARTVAKL